MRSWLCIVALVVTSVSEGNLYQARTEYKRAIFALETGRTRDFRRALTGLADYPLHPYLVYYDARSRLAKISPEQAESLKESLSTLHLGDRLFSAWLIAQAKRGRWQVYRDAYVPHEGAKARCYYARSLYRTGDRDAALELVPDLWISSTSQPKACDALFKTWIAQGGLTGDMAWQRLGLALGDNETTLARYLLRFFSGKQAAAARTYYDGHVRPEIVRQASRFADTAYGVEALVHALIRYARRDATDAAKQWVKYQDRLTLPEATVAFMNEQLTLALARDGEFREDIDSPSATICVGMAEASIDHEDWHNAVRWIESMDEADRRKLRWQYWLGRALIASQVDPERGARLLAALAKHRTYYGFLAADELGVQPALNERGAQTNGSIRVQLQRNPAIGRLTELYAVGDLVNARREWLWVFADLGPDDRTALVELASEIGWIDQAILGANHAELHDHLDLRFPTPYLGNYQRHAFETNLPLSFLFAISRQESAFNPSAISSSGARGLMQLMPGTARMTASRVRIKRPSRNDLFDPTINIKLGAHHLAELMTRYDNHRALVAAAYNAGANRVDKWRKARSGVPTDIWIEAIPYRETRNYVKNVLAFSYVYASRLDNGVPVLGANERIVP